MRRNTYFASVWLVLLAGLFLLAISACDSNAPPAATPEETALITGLGDMPKVLVTVVITPTPPPSVASPTPPSFTPTPTDTPEPPEPTRTPTPSVGIFVGEVDDNGTPIVKQFPPVAPPIGLPGSGIIGGNNIIGTPGVGGLPINCPIAVDANFINAFSQNPMVAQSLGCALDAGFSLTLVTQLFDRGQMFWRETGEIYVFPSTGRYYQMVDQWNESIPASDPAFDNAPEGKFQPVRGFGLVWRSNTEIRDALGWALNQETLYTGFIQNFQGGYMLLANNNTVYAVHTPSGVFYGPLAGR